MTRPAPYLNSENQSERTWQRMLSGRRLNLIHPSPVDIEIEDIALGLSRNTRWNGQTKGPYGWSVGQHSLLVYEIIPGLVKRPPARLLMTALLHDASEYVTHDIITPLKRVLGAAFREIEDRLMAAVYTRFGLPAQPSPQDYAIVKKADLIAAATEAVQLAGFSPVEVASLLGIREKPLTDRSLVPHSPDEVCKAFLATFAMKDKAFRLESR